jgi:hypothetical protein
VTSCPTLYKPTPHFSNDINRNIIQSEIEGGVYLRDLSCGALLKIEMGDWTCTMIYCGESEALISGHRRFCPDLVKVHVSGSTWGGSMLKQGFIGRGMRLEFHHPVHNRIVTSAVKEIHVRSLSEALEPSHSR